MIMIRRLNSLKLAPKHQNLQDGKIKSNFRIYAIVQCAGNGLGVDGVRADGPAGKAGLKKGDVIVEINGSALKTFMDI